MRETREEIGVEVDENDLREVAVLDFFFENNKEWNQKAIVFFLEKWKGEPLETEEMKPEWFSVDEIPYGKMWIDDIHWLPRVLAGEKLDASFTFDKTGEKVLNMEIRQV